MKRECKSIGSLVKYVLTASFCYNYAYPLYRTRDNGYRSKHVGAFMPIKYFGMILCKDKISRNINPSFHVGVVFQAS
jgi:hypothetical protein